MKLHGKEYTVEFLEQLIKDVVQISDYIEIDIESENFNLDACDIEGYEEFANKYKNLEL